MIVAGGGKVRRVFVDLDGVLADFDGHHEKLFGVRPDRSLPDPPDFWKKIYKSKTFFRDLPVMADGRALWDGIKLMHPEPVILTGIPMSVPGVDVQKREWVAEHLGPTVPVITVRSKQKALHGKPGDVLIDDWDKYKDIWEKNMGGIFILHTSAADSLNKLAKIMEVSE